MVLKPFWGRRAYLSSLRRLDECAGRETWQQLGCGGSDARVILMCRAVDTEDAMWKGVCDGLAWRSCCARSAQGSQHLQTDDCSLPFHGMLYRCASPMWRVSHLLCIVLKK